MSICSLKINRSPDGRLIKHKARLCAHVVIWQWGVDYWDTNSPVVNCMYVRAIITLSLSIIREIYTMSVDFVRAYTQADVKTEIFMELPIGFVVEEAHPR